MIFGAPGDRALPLGVTPPRLASCGFASEIDRPYRQIMNPKIICFAAALSLALNAHLFAAAGKTYEMTGTVVAASGTTLAIQKGTEKYEFAIDPATVKGSAELKGGSTVTVTYVMSVTKVETATAATPASSP
jgi:hypothetical protein